MPRDLNHLEDLFRQREELLPEYAHLEAEYAHTTWSRKRLEVDEAQIRERLRAGAEDGTKKADISAQLHLDPEYAQLLARVIDGRRRWAVIRERWAILGWRIQVELSKHRLNLDEAAQEPDSHDGDEG